MKTSLRRFIYHVGVLLLPLLVLALLFHLDQAIPDDAEQWQRQMTLLQPTGNKVVTLPWSEPFSDPVGIARARAEVSFSVPGGDMSNNLALLVPRPYSSFEIELNDRLLTRRGQQTPPISWLRWPVLIELPAAALKAGENRLVISTAREARARYLPEMLIGSHVELQAHDLRLRFFGKSVVLAVVAATVVLGLLVLGLFLFRPRETAYGWFALTLLIWSWHNAHDQIEHIPIANRHVWFATSYLSLGWFVIVATIFVHRFLGLKPRRVEWPLWLFGMIGSLVVLGSAQSCGNCFYPVVQSGWVPIVILIGFYLVLRLLLHAWRDPQPEYLWLLPTAWVASAVGVRDYLWEIGVLPWGTTYYLAHASALVLVVFAVIMLRRYASALNESESLNRELEIRVARKADELERKHRDLRHTERQHARLAERELIMRDMHDTLGGNLVQALAMMGQDEQATDARDAVERCLTDLRVILDSSELDGGDVIPLIAAFRHRIERGLRRAGIDLTLRMADLPVCTFLSGSESLHLLRILQEAINNVVKHARAKRITLNITCDLTSTAALVVSVCDDGVGFQADQPAAGRGMGNMQWRAQTMGATVTHRHGNPGTHVDIRVPLIRPAGVGDVAPLPTNRPAPGTVA